ncbi:MAG: hypothetical protein LAO51_20105 [Acidobacteriia bacterium]|nr:hypothetical protein [Terriglobia bacterium]
MGDSERSGRIEYPHEGFSVTWDENGLSVEVTDYHAGVLRLPWNALFSIAKCAGQEVGPASVSTEV